VKKASEYRPLTQPQAVAQRIFVEWGAEHNLPHPRTQTTSYASFSQASDQLLANEYHLKHCYEGQQKTKESVAEPAAYIASVDPGTSTRGGLLGQEYTGQAQGYIPKGTINVLYRNLEEEKPGTEEHKEPLNLGTVLDAQPEGLGGKGGAETQVQADITSVTPYDHDFGLLSYSSTID